MAVSKKTSEFLDWVDKTNKALKPVNYQVVRLLPYNLMPYSHVSLVTDIENEIFSEKYNSDEEEEVLMTLTLNGDQVDVLENALVLYKTILLKLHDDEIKKDIKAVIEGIGKAQKEGKLDKWEDSEEA